MQYLKTIILVLFILLAFIIYYFVSNLKIIEKYFFERKGEERGQMRIVLIQRLTGVLFFGIIPALLLIIINNSTIIVSVIKIHFNISSFIIVLVLAILAFLINYFAAQSHDNLNMYPQIRIKTWSLSLLILSGLSWMTYLFAYEFLFRGILLFYCIQETGYVAAILINICLYSLVHIPKGEKEAIGAIPMGIILCILTIHSGTIWMAFWIHCSLALSNEWFSIKYHPSMKVLVCRDIFNRELKKQG